MLAAGALPWISAGLDILLSGHELSWNSSGDVFVQHSIYLWSLCALTAVVEELVFRGPLFQKLLGSVGSSRTLWITSAVFALFHILPLSGIPSGEAGLLGLSLGLKGLQALSFGLIMGGIILYGCGLLKTIVVHGLFDVLYFALPVLKTGSFPSTYISADPLELWVLAATIALMAIPALQSLRKAKWTSPEDQS